MMIQGKVINVQIGVDYPKKDGSGSYDAFILKYVNGRGEVKEIVKPTAGLKYKPTIKTVLGELSAGDAFSLQMEENKGGYLDIVALVKGEGGIDAAVQSEKNQPTTSTYTRPATGKVVGNTYETPAERKLKQRLIVREAAINAAIEMLSVAKEKTVNVDVVFEAAGQFESWVYRDLETKEGE